MFFLTLSIETKSQEIENSIAMVGRLISLLIELCLFLWVCEFKLCGPVTIMTLQDCFIRKKLANSLALGGMYILYPNPPILLKDRREREILMRW